MSEDTSNDISKNVYTLIKLNLITIYDLNNLFEKYNLFCL
jgi:hypothetical protein